jgi:hypothetical protein
MAPVCSQCKQAISSLYPGNVPEEDNVGDYRGRIEVDSLNVAMGTTHRQRSFRSAWHRKWLK